MKQMDKGRYTKVSLYLPPNRPIYDVIAQLRHERFTIQQIKDYTTRIRLTRAHDTVIGFLKGYKRVEGNGLVIFAENDTVRIKEPKRPIDYYLYRCDDEFAIKPELN